MANLESSLRSRASRAKYSSAVCLSLSVVTLIFAYISLPWFIDKALFSIVSFEIDVSTVTIATSNDLYIRVFSIAVLFVGIAAIAFACYLLSRFAFIQLELSVRFNGLADALCICGNDLALFDKASIIFAPKTKYVSDVFTSKYITQIASEVLKQAKR